MSKTVWSHSRANLFRQCKRRYYLYYILADKGWLKSAPPESHRAWLLKKITNLPMWAGSVVHDTIENILSQKRRTKATILPLNKAEQMAVQMLRNGFLQSRNGEWDGNSKAVRLFEHHYDIPPTDGQCADLKAKVLRCIANFYQSPIHDWVRDTDTRDWLTLENFQTFQMANGGEVMVKIDFGLMHNDNFTLVDWKTGKPSDDVKRQLTVYAMYAMKTWGAKLPRIVAIPVYLDSTLGIKQTEEIEISRNMVLEQAKTIREELAILEEAHKNCGNIDFFTITDNKTHCEKCPFREICSGAQEKLIEEGKTPF